MAWTKKRIREEWKKTKRILRINLSVFVFFPSREQRSYRYFYADKYGRCELSIILITFEPIFSRFPKHFPAGGVVNELVSSSSCNENGIIITP